MTEGPEGASPAVSVIVPTYERRELVRRAVASVLAQAVKDFELIIVDDGSTDDTRSAVEGLDPRIRFQWQDNRGVSAARNTGIRLARGPVVAFLDADDRWLPDHLAVVTDVLSRHPEAVLCTTAPRFHVGGRQRAAAAIVVDALPALFAENIVGHHSAVAVRQEALAASGGFDERLTVMEGWELWLRLAAVGPFALLQRRTFIHQSTRGSLSERGSRGGNYQHALDLVAAKAARLSGESDRADAADLRARAGGLAFYLGAQRAISLDDPVSVRAALAEACSRVPELSHEPQLVANRLSLIEFGAAGRLRSFSMAARLWPDPGADTPLYLRTHALVLALGLRRGSEAIGLLRGWPLGATARFLATNLPLFARLGRRAVQRRLHSGRDSGPIAPDPSGPVPYHAGTTERR